MNSEQCQGVQALFLGFWGEVAQEEAAALNLWGRGVSLGREKEERDDLGRTAPCEASRAASP